MREKDTPPKISFTSSEKQMIGWVTELRPVTPATLENQERSEWFFCVQALVRVAISMTQYLYHTLQLLPAFEVVFAQQQPP